MAPSLLHPPSQLSPASALQLSQQAPAVLQSSPSTVSSSPFTAFLSSSETPDLWIKYENLLLSCLRTGDEPAAHKCLERLVARFGDDNERVMALKGLLKEADAQNNGALERVLKEYDQILSDNDTNIVRQTLLAADGKPFGRTGIMG
jgi:ER membrane protein complex subunit 2